MEGAVSSSNREINDESSYVLFYKRVFSDVLEGVLSKNFLRHPFPPLISINLPPIPSSCLRACGLHSLHVSPFQYLMLFLKMKMVFNYFMWCGKSATVDFQGNLEPII